jgi:hypothetical protein
MPDEPHAPVDADLSRLLICRVCDLRWRPSMQGAALTRSYVEAGSRFHASITIPAASTICPQCTALDTLIEGFRKSQGTRRS